MNNVVCPNCGKENSSTNIKCNYCGHIINNVSNYIIIDKNINHFDDSSNDISKKIESELLENKDKIKKILNIIKIVIPIISFLSFFSVALIIIIIIALNNYHINKAPKDYLTTTGYLSGFTDCFVNENESEVCSAEYTYTVNDVTYTGKIKYKTMRDNFSKETKVKYNPSDPSISVVKYVSWDSYYMLFIVIVLGILFSFLEYFKIKKSFEKI